jgi:hypothetical protein
MTPPAGTKPPSCHWTTNGRRRSRPSCIQANSPNRSVTTKPMMLNSTMNV